MSKYAVILGNGDKIAVDGAYEISPIGALEIYSDGARTQVFAPGAWITVFKMVTVQTSLTPDQRATLMAKKN